MTKFASTSSMGAADEDDAILQQAGEDIVGALPACGLFDNHRYQIHLSALFLMPERFDRPK